jgi:hypothetical protein
MLFKKHFVDKGTVTVPKLKEIAYFLKEKENLTILWLPGGGRTTFGIDLQNKPILSKVTSERRLKNIIFIYVDVSLETLQLESHLKESLAKYSDQPGIRNKVSDILQKGFYVYFILDSVRIDTLKCIDYLLSFRSLNSERIKFINLITEKDFIQIRNSDNRLPSSFFHNVVKIPYFDKEETLEWLSNGARSLHMRVNAKNKEEIYNYCGGVPVLLKNCLRNVKAYLSVEAAFESLEMQSIINTYWKKLTHEERHIIYNSFKRSPLPNFPNEVKYLREHRLLNPDYSFDKSWIKYVDELKLIHQ